MNLSSFYVITSFLVFLLGAVIIFLFRKIYLLKKNAGSVQQKNNELFQAPAIGPQVTDKTEAIDAEKKRLEEKNRKLFKMSETVYKEKKKVDEELEKLTVEKGKLEEEKQKFQEKNKKLWQQSVAIHKEKERINIIKREVEAKHKDVMDSISYAQRIQRALLTSEIYFKKYLPEYFVLFKPRDIVSGDFYWLHSRAGMKNVLLATADCTGHGVPGAFMSMLGMSFLNEIVIEKKISQPDLIMNQLRENIIHALNPDEFLGDTAEYIPSESSVKDGMDMSVCRFDLEKMELHYAAANNGIYQIRDNEIISHKADKFPVGKHTVDLIPFSLKTVPLQKGDCLYTLTDGFADQFGGQKGKKFKYKQLEELLLSIYMKPMQEQKSVLDKAIEEWMKDTDQIDDICLIGIRV